MKPDIDIGGAFSFVTKDDQWITQILIGGLLVLVPILNIFALAGYMIQTGVNVAEGKPNPLPKWEDFSEIMRRGLHGFLIGLVYALPLIVLVFVFMCVIGGMGAAAGDQESAGALVGLLMLCLYPLMFVVGIAIQMVVLAAFVRYIQTGSVGAALRFGEVITTVRGDLRTWGLLVLLYILCGIVGNLGSIACGIGVLFSAIYAQAVFGHMLGQVAAQTRDPGAGLDPLETARL